jgi:hypothetical protein
MRIPVVCGAILLAVSLATGCSSNSSIPTTSGNVVTIAGAQNTSSASSAVTSLNNITSRSLATAEPNNYCPTCTPLPIKTPTPAPKTTPTPATQIPSSVHLANEIKADQFELPGSTNTIQQSQGNTFSEAWVCILLSTQTVCPSSGVSAWSGSVTSLTGSSGGITVNFTPQTTTGAATTIEQFVIPPNAPVGIYTASACLVAIGNQDSAPHCVSWTLVVLPLKFSPIAIPTYSPSQEVVLELGAANIPGLGVPIPYSGHLYIQEFISGLPAPIMFEAGPSNISAGEALDFLYTADYAESSVTDAQIDLGQYGITVAQLANLENQYIGYQYANSTQPSGNAPFIYNYNALTLNSNLKLARLRGYFPLGGERSTHGTQTAHPSVPT